MTLEEFITLLMNFWYSYAKYRGCDPAYREKKNKPSFINKRTRKL